MTKVSGRRTNSSFSPRFITTELSLRAWINKLGDESSCLLAQIGPGHEQLKALHASSRKGHSLFCTDGSEDNALSTMAERKALEQVKSTLSKAGLRRAFAGNLKRFMDYLITTRRSWNSRNELISELLRENHTVES